MTNINSNSNTDANPNPHSTSLLDGIDAPSIAPVPVAPRITWRTRLRDRWDARMADPSRARKTKRLLGAAAGVFLIGAGVGAYFALRPTPQPDYLDGQIDELFNYTLLTDEFNNLPVEKRLELISQLIKRLQSMKGQDSILLAGFASGIAGSAREQIKENASRLAVDMWDKYAKDYRNVPEEDRKDYLDKTFIDFVKTMEAMSGQQRDISDEERLEEVRRQAQRDRNAMSDPNRSPDGEALGAIFEFMNNDVGSNASPQQRQRGSQMLRDMARHFRGQDPETGKPVAPSAP